MNRILFSALLAAVLLCAQSPSPPVPIAATPLPQMKVVYLMPMGNGLGQYLANHLTTLKVLQVTTVAKDADAVLCDQIGEGFEKRFKELYPPPAPPVVEDEKEEDKEAGEKKDDKTDTVALKAEGEKRFGGSMWGRGKGNFYLVDVKSQQVVWSTYRKPKNLESKELDRTAETIVKQLQNDITGQPK